MDRHQLQARPGPAASGLAKNPAKALKFFKYLAPKNVGFGALNNVLPKGAPAKTLKHLFGR